MMDCIFEFSKQAGVPIDSVREHYDNFIKKGFIYTPAKTAEEFFSRKYPLRFAMAPPAASEGKSTFSLEPFAFTREEYEQTWSKLPNLLSKTISKNLNNVSLGIMYAFKRAQYEKLGASISEDELRERYRIEAQEEAFEHLCGMMGFWDVTKPDVRELFVWIPPNRKCRQFAEKI